MTTLPAANFMNDDARTQGEMKTAFEDMRQVIEDMFGVDSTLPMVQKNHLINGGFDVSQRGVSFNSATIPINDDDTVLVDRWVLLSDGDDVVDVSQETVQVPASSRHAIALDVETGNLKFGILQVLEARDAAALIGSTASLSFKARISGSSIDHLRAAIISWDSGEDMVTRDVVAAWNGVGVDPTLAANWTYENAPANLATLTSNYQTFKIENISIDTANARNVGVFIWVDDVTLTVTDILYIADVMLAKGTTASNFARRSYAEELAICQRYCWGVNADDGDCVGNGFASLTTEALILLHPPVTMRQVPTLNLVGAVADFEVDDGAAAEPATAIALDAAASAQAILLRVTTLSNLTQFRPYNFQDDGSSGESGDFFFDAEL